MMLITFGIHLYEICSKNVFLKLICLVYFQNCAAIKKKPIHTILYSVLSRTEKGHGIFFLLKFNALPQFLKVGRAIAPSSFAHEVVLVKFELQTHMEHLNSCQSGFLVVCAS